MTTRRLITITIIPLSLIALGSAARFAFLRDGSIGKQSDGSYLLSTGQRIQGGTIAFKGRPADICIRPQGDIFAVTVKDQHSDTREVLLVSASDQSIISHTPMRHEPGFHGLVWSPDGSRLFASTGGAADDNAPNRHDGVIETFDFAEAKLKPGVEIVLNQAKEPGNVVPGGLCISKDGTKLYVPATDLNATLEIDAKTGQRLRKLPGSMLPFAAKLSEDEQTLIVSNWGGRIPTARDRKSKTGISEIAVTPQGSAISGTVSLIDLRTGVGNEIEVEIHPTAVLVLGSRAYVANAMSDSVSEIDIPRKRVARTFRLAWNGLKLLGSMPVALSAASGKLYACNGGDNALAEIEIATGRVNGYRPAGFFPIALQLQGDKAWVLNSKGNGSVAKLGHGQPAGNAHDFEGTISVIDLKSDLAAQTRTVALQNEWGKEKLTPSSPVYNGAIKHVIYIIKENRTYDEVFGDMPEGNGDPKLAILGKTAAPNHQALAREFTLFDNGYVSGTNSCDGHAWSTQALANDYIEHFYVGYSRTYNDDGNCAMSLSNTGAIWDAALAKGLSVRDFGEFCYADIAKYQPYRPKDWFEAWDDRKRGTHKFTYEPVTLVPSLKPLINKRVHYWPLIQSDQSRADEFLREYSVRSQNGTLPNLSILTLCCDHTEGMDPDYPAPKSMVADNDLALGRVVDAVSHSPEWKDTCICVIEDDAQNGPDHVDGHRTVFMVISPYNRRHYVDHTRYTTVNMIKSMEMMLGISPMNRFDTIAQPITTCFQETPDLSPYHVQPNNVRLDEPNPGRKAASMTLMDRYWTQVTKNLDWSKPDAPDSDKLNRIIWYSLRGNTPYPGSASVAQKGDDE